MQKIRVAAVQCALGDSLEKNVVRVTGLIEQAAAKGAQVIVIPELFEGPYFCKSQKISNFELAQPAAGHRTIARMQELAKRHAVVLPVPIFEKDGPHFYNSIAMLDADGSVLGIYRKTHIPDGPGYQEKYHFRPGDLGLKVWDTRYGRIGVGICWDQWFPEVARCMALQGAQLLLYPTAIGTEPMSPDFDTKDLWQRSMIGHAVHNVLPVAAANRIGDEDGQRFYGSSFVANHSGDMVSELGRTEEGIALAEIDLRAAGVEQAAFGFFRDRRPEIYRHML